jgi:hypothetical protein
MEDVFNNLLIFIPVAFLIAVRIINARNKQSKRNRESADDTAGGLGELIKKIKELQDDPGYDDNRADAREYRPQGAPAGLDQPHWETKPVPVRQPAKASTTAGYSSAAKKKTKKPSSGFASGGGYNSPFPDTAGAGLPSEIKNEPTAQKISPDVQTRKELTPLQQAVVWSEILGQPKGFC